MLARARAAAFAACFTLWAPLLGAQEEEEATEELIPTEAEDVLGVDGLEARWGGKIQSDLRFRVEEKATGGFYSRRVLGEGVERNENLIGPRLDIKYGDVAAKADLDLVLYGFSEELQSLDDLSRRERLDPVRFDVHQLYVKLSNLIDDEDGGKVDVTVGQQLILWGVSDQFNPTNVLNADDVEDLLLFGEQQGNFMVRLDWWPADSWSVSGVLVPIFRPALLPRSAPLGIALSDRLPFVDESYRLRTHAEQAAASTLALHPFVVENAKPVLPEPAFDNMQFALRAGGDIGEQDIALMYYVGRNDFPVARHNHVRDLPGTCNPANPEECVNGLLATTVDLEYPRMQMFGFNMAGEIGWLAALSDVFNAVGYRIEVGFFIPERRTLMITNDELDLEIVQIPAGVFDYNGPAPGIGNEPVVLDERPFAKWTVGLDYTFGEHLYTNIQWVHGLVDEFGAGDWIQDGVVVREGGVTSDEVGTLTCAQIDRDGTRCARELVKPRLGDYLVTGVDLHFLNNRALIRLFTIFDLTGIDETFFDPAQGARVTKHHGLFSDQGFGAVIYPELGYNFGYGFELGGGALFQLGKDHGKFGDPAAGGSIAWFRSRYSF